MKFFNLMDIQQVYIFFFPAIASVFIVGIALGFTYLKSRRSEQETGKIYHHYPDGLMGGRNPIPVIVYIAIAGPIIWMIFYILAIGLMQKRI